MNPAAAPPRAPGYGSATQCTQTTGLELRSSRGSGSGAASPGTGSAGPSTIPELVPVKPARHVSYGASLMHSISFSTTPYRQVFPVDVHPISLAGVGSTSTPAIVTQELGLPGVQVLPLLTHSSSDSASTTSESLFVHGGRYSGRSTWS